MKGTLMKLLHPPWKVLLITDVSAMTLVIIVLKYLPPKHPLSLAGYLFWMEYMPENFPKALASVYPICYNYAVLGAEAVLTLIVISIPAVAKALDRIKAMAQS